MAKTVEKSARGIAPLAMLRRSSNAVATLFVRVFTGKANYLALPPLYFFGSSAFLAGFVVFDPSGPNTDYYMLASPILTVFGWIMATICEQPMDEPLAIVVQEKE